MALRPWGVLSAASLLFIIIATPASAQATRTWVSGVGDDANPCSRTAPCKTFAGAISKTATGGEISVLDPGGYGVVTISKSITINGTGTLAGLLAAGTNGVIINAPAGSTVTLRGISINGAGTGISGVRWIGGTALHIENCDISGFTSRGVSAEVTGGGSLMITDTIIQNIGSFGVVVMPSVGSATIAAVLDGTRIQRIGSHGMYAGDGARVTIRNSTISNNGGVGLIVAQSAGVTTQANVESTLIASNGSGIYAGTGASTTRISNVTIVNNTGAGFEFGGGSIISFGNNRIHGNGSGNGPATSNVGQQ
jgi:hypothetical protein